jgi:hypothetical protein
MKIRIFELYPTSKGFSPFTKYYNGSYVKVIAKNLRHALFLVYNDIYSDGDGFGIIEIYDKNDN